ncbi:right-handed parallel beta-helix repeat-containing protein [Haliscomenobacter hydrossis]|uniref:Parallel beta-helix repeat protein n=1 Tax=Haliscomenobacter hydrossis (strain ATCC 27775 / DSM 1100 / LMG 10767 / O) TaxID=760192 RepID=F4KR42_HALH1|nr:right-handed parallel beta-helix repeat-containing protein [Haliscomenobacter hydrossis]AEE53280.1 parallel beta-helix repeat protein [Haliscomenobacter hydrossis DSM 1100]
MKQFTLPFLLILCCLCRSNAVNYYFSTTEGDDNRSTLLARNPKTPWKTSTKLNNFFSQLKPGDSVLFKRGEVFFGEIRMTQSGTNALPIVLGAYGKGERPVISGFTTVSGWKSLGGGIYESPVLTTTPNLNLVVINGVNYAMGRYPNENAANKGYLNFESFGSNFIVDNQLNSSINWKNGELVIRTTRWTIERLPITAHNKKQLTFGSSLRNALTNGYGFFIQNHLQTLDKFGEWFYNSSTKKLYVFLGNTATANVTVQVGTVNLLVEPRASHLVLDNLTLTGANQYNVYGEWANLQNLRIKNSQILFSGIDAIKLSQRLNFVLENCTIAHSNSKAVNLNYNNLRPTLRNNKIINTGIFPGMIVDGQSYAVVSTSKGLVAEYNTITNSGYVGIRFTGDSNLVKNNLIDRFCTVLDDGAGIYTWTGGQNMTYNKRSIIGNIIVNGIGAPEGTNRPDIFAAEGIYLDDNSTNVEISGNSVAHCRNNGIYVHNSRNLQILNNTFFNNGVQFTTVHDDLGQAISNLTISNNKFFSKKPDQINALLRSKANDFQNIGSFSGNYYARPLDDNMTIFTQNYKTNTKQWYSFKSWQASYGKNKEAGASPVQIKPHTLISIDDDHNKYPNKGFETGVSGLYCWSPTNDCFTVWTTTSPLEGRAIKISGASYGQFNLEVGSIDRNKQYILRFSVLAESESDLNVYLVQSYTPWQTLSTIKSIRITPTRTNYEVLISNPVSEASTSIQFQSVNGKFSYWLDNVSLCEAVASPTNPDDYIRFEYNPTTTNKTISLETSYLDVKKTLYSGSVVLKPFESIVLVKDVKNVASLSGSLDYFNSRLEECQVQLNWAYIVEDNFSHFEVERSEDGINFATLSRINKKNNPGLQSFQYLDAELGARNFYRLKRVKTDGKFTYSEVREEQTDCSSRNSWQINPTLLHPGNAELAINLFTKETSLWLTIIDQFGRKIRSIQSETLAGWNKLSWNIDDLPIGMYYLHRSDVLIKRALPFVVSKN